MLNWIIIKRIHRKTLFVVLFLFFIIPIEGEEIFLYNKNFQTKTPLVFENSQQTNVFQDSDSFPDPLNTDFKHHKIVKKQMDVSDKEYMNGNLKKRQVLDEKERMQKTDAIASTEEKTEDDGKSNLWPNGRDKTSHKFRRSKTIVGFFEKLKPNAQKQSFERIKKSKIFLDEKLESDSDLKKLNGNFNFNLKSNELNSDNIQKLLHISKYHSRVPIKRNYQSSNCQPQLDARKSTKKKRCIVSDFFSPKYVENIQASGLNMVDRIKRSSYFLSPKKIDVPDQAPDDTEPANEWMDATQSNGPKIPSEFKPKPKQRLKIYHLKSKRKPKEKRRRKVSKKRHTFAKLVAIDGQHRFMRTNRANKRNHQKHYPRSFHSRVIKKESKKSSRESAKENDEKDEEIDEEDDYEEDEDDNEKSGEEEEASEKSEKKEKFNLTQNIKDFLKPDKGAKLTKDTKAKLDGGSIIPFKSSLPKLTPFDLKLNTKSNISNLNEKSKKVLIDADIRVDSAISSALKNMLTKRKEKDIKNSDMKLTIISEPADCATNDDQKTKFLRLS